MKLYLIATGIVFALVVVAHAARIVVEGTGPLSDPVFLIGTIAALALCGWAVALLRQGSGAR